MLSPGCRRLAASVSGAHRGGSATTRDARLANDFSRVYAASGTSPLLCGRRHRLRNAVSSRSEARYPCRTKSLSRLLRQPRHSAFFLRLQTGPSELRRGRQIVWCSSFRVSGWFTEHNVLKAHPCRGGSASPPLEGSVIFFCTYRPQLVDPEPRGGTSGCSQGRCVRSQECHKSVAPQPSARPLPPPPPPPGPVPRLQKRVRMSQGSVGIQAVRKGEED